MGCLARTCTCMSIYDSLMRQLAWVLTRGPFRRFMLRTTLPVRWGSLCCSSVVANVARFTFMLGLEFCMIRSAFGTCS